MQHIEGASHSVKHEVISSGFTDRHDTSSLKNPSSQYNLGFTKQHTDVASEPKSMTPSETDDGTVKYAHTDKSPIHRTK